MSLLWAGNVVRPSLAGLALALLAPSTTLAQNLTASSGVPSVRFDDTDDEICTPAFDWQIVGSGGVSDDDVNNSFVIYGVSEPPQPICGQDIPIVILNHDGGSLADSSINSLEVFANGDISFANGAMILDKSTASLDLAGGLVADGDVSLGSSRELKHQVEPVALDATLDAVLDLGLYRWTYKQDESAVRHLGPMAEDVHGRLGLGRDEAHLSPADTAGLALAALQALHHRFEATTRRLAEANHELAAHNQRLEERLAALERSLGEKSGN